MSRWTNKQRAFVNAYLSETKDRWNGTAAARQARYKGNDATLAAVAYENLRKPHIAEEIKRRIEADAMTAHEVLDLLGAQARGSMEELLAVDESGSASFDFKKARDAKKLHLIKSLAATEFGWRVELYDAHAALVDIGKHLGLFVDRLALTDPTGKKPYRSAEELSDDELAAIIAAHRRGRGGGGTVGPEEGAPPPP